MVSAEVVSNFARAVTLSRFQTKAEKPLQKQIQNSNQMSSSVVDLDCIFFLFYRFYPEPREKKKTREKTTEYICVYKVRGTE